MCVCVCVHVCKVDPPIPAALGTGKKNEVLENIFGTWGEVVNGIRGGGQRRGDIGGGATLIQLLFFSCQVPNPRGRTFILTLVSVKVSASILLGSSGDLSLSRCCSKDISCPGDVWSLMSYVIIK